jgi:hypothetical protein
VRSLPVSKEFFHLESLLVKAARIDLQKFFCKINLEISLQQQVSTFINDKQCDLTISSGLFY